VLLVADGISSFPRTLRRSSGCAKYVVRRLAALIVDIPLIHYRRPSVYFSLFSYRFFSQASTSLTDVPTALTAAFNLTLVTSNRAVQ
jgi:hypothetical protein